MFIWLGLLSGRGGWLDGQESTVIIALVYGYMPFLILPLYASLGRIDQRQIEAARDLGASPFSGFLRVTLPLSVPGDPGRPGADRAADVRRLLHARSRLARRPRRNMIGNQIDQLTRQGSEKVTGAVLTILLALVLLVLMIYYLRATRRATREPAAA